MTSSKHSITEGLFARSFLPSVCTKIGSCSKLFPPHSEITSDVADPFKITGSIRSYYDASAIIWPHISSMFHAFPMLPFTLHFILSIVISWKKIFSRLAGSLIYSFRTSSPFMKGSFWNMVFRFPSDEKVQWNSYMYMEDSSSFSAVVLGKQLQMYKLVFIQAIFCTYCIANTLTVLHSCWLWRKEIGIIRKFPSLPVLSFFLWILYTYISASITSQLLSILGFVSTLPMAWESFALDSDFIDFEMYMNSRIISLSDEAVSANLRIQLPLAQSSNYSI